MYFICNISCKSKYFRLMLDNVLNMNEKKTSYIFNLKKYPTKFEQKMFVLYLHLELIERNIRNKLNILITPLK